MKNHLQAWLETGIAQAIKEDIYKGVDIHVRYNRGFQKFQFIFLFGRSGYNSAFAYCDTASAIDAARKKIDIFRVHVKE
jgi:hypothetical protein